MNKFIRRAFEKIEKLSTEEIKTLVRYQASENELLGQALQEIDIGFIVTNSSGRVLSCNSAAKRMLPRSKKLTEGTTLRFIIEDEDVASFFEQALSSVDEHHVLEKEFHFPYGDGVISLLFRANYFETALEPVYDKDDGKRFLFVMYDVTEKVIQQARLHRSESLASLTTVAAGVAHEIKNPLASIGIHLQLLKKAFKKKGSLKEQEAATYVDVIDEEIDRLNGIVVDFLFAVRPMDVHLRYENVNTIIEDVLNFVGYELSEHNIEIRQSLEQYLPKLRIDENLLKQALLNIIKNAMNAMEKKGGRFTVTTKLDGDRVTIALSDTGVG